MIAVAIDGPAASGKSSVARSLAQKINYLYVNSGAMYRAFTWYVLHRGIPVSDDARVIELLRSTNFQGKLCGNASSFLLDDINPEEHLCDADVNANVSKIASIPEVREVLVAKQREYLNMGNLVMEGRDIGSVVFPETPYKFYIDASPEVRAQRRAQQGMHDEIAARDKFDSTRRTSPLVIAEDAHVIDSSHLTIEGVVGEIIGRLKLKGLQVNV